jgi:Protein of unknown function (DUF1629)
VSGQSGPRRSDDNAAQRCSAAPPASRKSGAPKKRKIYLVSETQTTREPGWDIVNEKSLFRGGPPIFWPPDGKRGFRDYPETPLFLFDSRRGRRPVRDFEEIDDYWFVSDRVKAVFESVDPEAFEFLKCRVQLRDGSAGPLYWLCDVVRVLDAIDEAKSNIMIATADDGSKVYHAIGRPDIAVRGEVVGSHHIFRAKYSEEWRLCDETLRMACVKAGVKLSISDVGYIS